MLYSNSVSKVHEARSPFAQELAKKQRENMVLESTLNNAVENLNYGVYELNNSYVFIELQKDRITELVETIDKLEDKQEVRQGIIKSQEGVAKEHARTRAHATHLATQHASSCPRPLIRVNVREEETTLRSRRTPRLKTTTSR